MSDKDIDRRTLVNGLIVAGAAAAIPREAHSQTQVPNSSGTEAPKLKAPVNACDCHMHIYDEARSGTEPHASSSSHRATTPPTTAPRSMRLRNSAMPEASQCSIRR